MNHDIRWIGLMLVVIAMGTVMMDRFPIMGIIQIVAGAASAAWHLKLLLERRIKNGRDDTDQH